MIQSKEERPEAKDKVMVGNKENRTQNNDLLQGNALNNLLCLEIQKKSLTDYKKKNYSIKAAHRNQAFRAVTEDLYYKSKPTVHT